MTKKIGLYNEKRNKGRPWVVRWFGEYDPASGKQRRYSKSFRLKVAAEQFQAVKVQEFGQGARRDGTRETVLGDFLKDWLRIRKTELRPSSLELYDRTVKRLLGHFGKDSRLTDITPQKAAAFVGEQKSLAIGHEARSGPNGHVSSLRGNARPSLRPPCSGDF